MKLPKFISLFFVILAGALAIAETDRKEDSGARDDGEISLQIGHDIPLRLLQDCRWIQGEPPKAWKAGEVYIVEVWGTWCGPCIANIPHLNGIYKKYNGKGIYFYSLMYHEPDFDKAEKFVKSKGDGLSYPVGYVDPGDARLQEEIGKNGAPCAYVFVDGKLVFHAHPYRFNDEVLEDLAAGGDRRKKVFETFASENLRDVKYQAIFRNFDRAIQLKDWDEAKECEQAMRSFLGEKNPSAADGMAFRIAMLTEKWDQVLDLTSRMDANRFVNAVMDVRDENKVDFPENVQVAFVERLTRIFENEPEFYYGDLLLRFQWELGRKDQALVTMREIVKLCQSQPRLRDYYQKYQEALEKGKLPSREELERIMREIRSKESQ